MSEIRNQEFRLYISVLDNLNVRAQDVAVLDHLNVCDQNVTVLDHLNAYNQDGAVLDHLNVYGEDVTVLDNVDHLNVYNQVVTVLVFNTDRGSGSRVERGQGHRKTQMAQTYKMRGKR